MDRDTVVPRRRIRLPLIMGLGLAIAAAAWTAVWATARGRLLAEIDTRMAELADRGVVVTCGDRAIGGYPFRMELSCRAPGVAVAARGFSASAAVLRVVAQVWDPWLLLVEFDGPGSGADAGGEVAATWRDLRASLRWSMDGVRRLSVVSDGLDLTVRRTGNPAIRLIAEHAEAHGRPAGATGSDLDLAASFAAAALSVADKRLGPPRADLSASTTLIGFLPLGPGPAAPAFAARGGRIDPAKLSLAVGGVVVEGDGALVLGQTGELDGMITLVARGLESLAHGGAKDLGPELTTVLGGFVLLGKAPKDPATPGRRLEMVIDHGQVRIGRAMLGRIPPLFAGGS